MKKLYFLFTFLIVSSFGYSQTASITKVIETSCSSPFIKTIEIAVTGTIDFASDDIQLRISRNGNGFILEGDNPDLIDISGLGVQTDTYVYIIRDLALMQSDFPNAGITASNSVEVGASTNGDDAYQLAMADGTVISQFGVDNEDGTGEAWEHKDTYAERNAGTSETGTFVIGDWTVYAVDLLDDYGTCAKGSEVTGDLFETIITLGSWKTLSTKDFTKSELSIYPNPVNKGFVNLKSQIQGTKKIELFDIAGRSVLETEIDAEILNVSSINSGLYLLKISIDNRSSTTKLVIK